MTGRSTLPTNNPFWDGNSSEGPAKFDEKVRDAIRQGHAAEARDGTRTTTDGILRDGAVVRSISKKDAFNYSRHSWLDRVGLDRKLTTAALRVAILIWKYQNHQKGFAFPSYMRMARELKMHKSTVIRAVMLLERRGWLNIARRAGSLPRRDHVNQYRLAMGNMDEDD